jgi:hypothetical protein
MPRNQLSLSPLLDRIVALVGRRADDPELLDFFKGLGKKVPASTSDGGGSTKNVVAKKQGLEFAFTHDLKNQKYPLIQKTKKAFVPYLSTAWLTDRLPEPLPFGLQFGMSVEEITSRLGQPDEIGFGAFRQPCWSRVLDPARDVVLQVDPSSFAIEVDEALELSARYGVPPRPVVGLFVAWTILRNLLDEARFVQHASLVSAIRKRQHQGSALVDAALPRGLWGSHLKDEPGLRNFAYRWFHNIGGLYVCDDLVAVFGARKDRHGHDEPVLDDDDWQAVDQAAPKLDERFAEWLGKTPRKPGR